MNARIQFCRPHCMDVFPNDICFPQCVVHSVAEYVNAIESAYADGTRGAFNLRCVNRRLFFRGHADASWDLLPTIFRVPKGCRDEKSIALDYKQYMQQFGRDYDCYANCDRMLGDMQHYGIPTRLLDWTTDPLAALYFAVEESDVSKDDHAKRDGCVWIIDPWVWNEGYSRHCKFRAREHDANVLSRALLTYNWSQDEINSFLTDHGYPTPNDIELPYAVVNPFTNARKTAQRGCFMVFGKEDRDLREIRLFREQALLINVPWQDKAAIRNSLNLLNINAYAVYPDEHGMAEVVKKYKSLYGIRKCSVHSTLSV